MLRSIVQALRRPGTPTELKQFRAAAGVLASTVVSTTVNFPSIASGATAALAVTITPTGLVLTTSPVSMTLRSALPTGLVIAGVAVTGANTVTVYAYNYTVAAIDPAALNVDFIVYGA
jgi:hypothetical protein